MAQILFKAYKASLWLALCTSILICSIIAVQAYELSETDVRTAVQTWVRNYTPDAKPNALIGEMEAYVVNGNTVAYVVHIIGGGFCLCGADTVLLPVYLYNPIADYNPDISDYKYILDSIATIKQNI